MIKIDYCGEFIQQSKVLKYALRKDKDTPDPVANAASQILATLLEKANFLNKETEHKSITVTTGHEELQFRTDLYDRSIYVGLARLEEYDLIKKKKTRFDNNHCKGRLVITLNIDNIQKMIYDNKDAFKSQICNYYSKIKEIEEEKVEKVKELSLPEPVIEPSKEINIQFEDDEKEVVEEQPKRNFPVRQRKEPEYTLVTPEELPFGSILTPAGKKAIKSIKKYNKPIKITRNPGDDYNITYEIEWDAKEEDVSYCEVCGAVMHNKLTKCPVCGAIYDEVVNG